jgi:hypothetical protein
MADFTDNLWGDLVREQGATLTQAGRPEPGRGRLLRHPRVLAGSTLGLAGAGTALALGLTAVGSTPAFAVTLNTNGSVLVTVDQEQNIVQANAKLTAMGIHEQFDIYMASGPATTSGPVSCAPQPGASGPPLKVLLAKDGTEVIKPGTTGGNTGVGTWHIASCKTFKTGDTGSTGNTGSGSTGAIRAVPGSSPAG